MFTTLDRVLLVNYLRSYAIVLSCLLSLYVVIDLFTNLAYFHRFSVDPASPADNTYGAWSIVVPVIGGLIVGLMALYGSKAIRGHGGAW